MSQNWRKLPLPARDGLPPLLFRYIRTSQGYEIHLTDLTYIWTERLDHKQILERAEDEGTSIDPSEDAEQFQVLLQKIEDALSGSESSSVGLNTGARSHSLELTTTTRLPAPLRPLQWTLYLFQGPQNSLTKELLLPVLREEADRETRQRSLLDHLKEKDWVIGKVFDKLESSGLDLSTVFPGTAGLRTGKRGTTRSQAAKFIRGVAPFDEQSWYTEVGKGNSESGLAPKLVEELSGSTGALNLQRLDPAPDKWWEGISVGGRAPEPRKEGRTAPRVEDTSSKQANRKKDISDDEASEDEFQRQETPPRLKRAKEDRQQPDRGRSDVRRKSTNPSRSPSPESPKQKSKGLGTIGGGKAAKKGPPPRRPSSTASESSLPTQPSPAPAQAPDPEQQTESEEEEPESQPSPKSERAEKAPSQKPRPRGLGVIGGKKAKAPSPSPSPPPEKPQHRATSSTTDNEIASPSPKKPKRPGKLGVIGGGGARNKDVPSRPSHGASITTRGAAAESTASEGENDNLDSAPAHPKTNAPASRSASPPPQRAKKEEEPEPELTAQEKADRKREELKRQLEAKSKAPVKKRRKF